MSEGSARPVHLSDLGRGRRPARRRRWIAIVLSAAGHVLVFLVLFWAKAPPPVAPEPPAMLASLAQLPQPEPDKPPAPPAPTQTKAASAKPAPAPPKPVPARHSAVRAVHTPAPAVLAAAAPKAADTSDILSDAQVAGASSPGEGEGGGGGGGVCDMARLVQRALRRDPLVQAAVLDAHRAGRAVMVWNGDWVKRGDQDGKGLAAVREAIMWEIAFAPAACRAERVHGMVLLSLNDGLTRLAVGAGDWRWSDLLATR
jgi:hypothetical protein